MSFGLCNAPSTFQICMLSIFSDMVERIMEVFMDDLTIYGEDFGDCLSNLETILQRCIEKNLVLNWEKCHFMVEKGTVLGHVISRKDIKVDKAKIELIVNLPPPKNVKETRQFLVEHIPESPPIKEEFPNDTLLKVDTNSWYAHIANYLVTRELPKEWTTQERRFFLSKVHAYYWEEPFLYKYCADQIIRKCVPEEEQQGFLMQCHAYACGGHLSTQKTALKVLQSGFYWPTVFKDAHEVCKSCDKCQRLGKLTKRHMMPLNRILVEAIACKHNDQKMVVKFLKENIFTRFRVPKAIVSEGGTHFCNKIFNNLLARYGVKHKAFQMGNQKRKSSDIEKEFMTINDGNGKDTNSESPSGFSLSKPPFSGHPNQRNVTRSSMDKDKSKMVGHGKLLSIIVEAPTPTPVTKYAPPPSQPLQFRFTKVPKKKLATGAREDCLGALDIPLTSPNPAEIQPITQTEAAEMGRIVSQNQSINTHVHLKQLQRAKKYPLFFPRMLGTILEYYGFPTEPGKEKKHHCREVYTISRWQGSVTKTESTLTSASLTIDTEHYYVSPPNLILQDFGDGEDTPLRPLVAPTPEVASTLPNLDIATHILASLSSTPNIGPSSSDGYVHISAEAFNQLLARLDRIQENQATIQLTQQQLVQRVDELTMAVQQWKSSSEKPTSVDDVTPLSIPTTQETNSSERKSTVPTTIVTSSEIIPSLHLMLEDRE
ncbi:Retrovirus-related Pol polyprotein from transposon opus [Vitis vinifera]|uniref:Retrovirus-related Pol polyprotein from transposon opus n=1 Tax=Vitis vinifera TaxID=29760 RepID=A0A438H9D1_VITVI|nr:Retrovirus-related Pol polyprotein from transposon opus [Vitis vinifera]